MGFLEESDKEEIKKEFSSLVKTARLHFFYSDDKTKCMLCEETKQILGELSELSDKIEVKSYEFETNSETAKAFKIEKLPAIAITKDDDKDFGIRWFGIPAGYEFMSLIGAILDIGSEKADIPDEIIEQIKKIDKPVHLQVFVTPTCPHCINAVRIAHTFAYFNENIRGDMIEASEFPELSEKHSVMAVPKIVINDLHSFEGALPFPHFLEKVKEAIK